jgi:transcriptional regulator with XRE-family HTH domain
MVLGRPYFETKLDFRILKPLHHGMEWWNRIAAAREAAGLTQEQLAKLVHVAQPTLGNYEIGKREPRLAVIEKIAAATGTTPEWLAFGVGSGPAGDDDKNPLS